jgi:hypothetical protein
MKTKISYKGIVAMKPCYMPEEIGIEKGYSATIPDFINEYRDKVKSPEDIIWVVVRPDYMNEKDRMLFAVWCARQALRLIKNPDQRSIDACDVAERYANGEATDDELAAAGTAAAKAARTAEWAAARTAARAAAWATRAAARASGAAARAAAWATTGAAAWVTGAAAWATRAAAWAAEDDVEAAGAAAIHKQIDKLLTFF